MPVGLSNAPADVLRVMLGPFGYVYLEDILIYSCSLQEYQEQVCTVLQRLLEN